MAGLVDPEQRVTIRSTMSRQVGVLRRPEGLHLAAATLADVSSSTTDVVPTRRAFEATNLLTVAAVVVAAATARTESRGCHRRTDYPEARDVWLAHLDVRLDHDGAPTVAGVPAAVLGEPMNVTITVPT